MKKKYKIMLSRGAPINEYGVLIRDNKKNHCRDGMGFYEKDCFKTANIPLDKIVAVFR